MKILAFAASSSRNSINKQLIRYAARLLEHGPLDATVEIIDLNDYEMPIYSIDRQNEDGIPRAAHDFFHAIGDADALVVSFAEHNGSYTAAYKNIFDWASRIDMRVYQDTPTVMLATSAGPGGGAHVLESAVASAPFFGNDLTAHLAIPSFHANFDSATNRLTNPDLDAQLQSALSTLAREVAPVGG